MRLHGDGPTIAATIRAAVLETEGLHCTVGVAPNKFLAKLATEQGKPTASARGPIPGTGVTVVRPGDELAFLRPLPAAALWGVGPKTLEKLRRIGVRTVADIEQMPVELLVRTLGDASGRHLHQLARAIDDRPVVADARPKSIGHEETFASDIHSHADLHVHLVRMADAVASRVRHHGLPGRTVTIKVRFGDFSTITRSATAARPVDSGPSIVRMADTLLGQIDVARGVRLFGVTLSNLVPVDEVDDAPLQLTLNDMGPSGDEVAPAADGDGPAWNAVTEAIDAVRARFGRDAVVPATLVGDERRTFRPGEQQWGPNRAGNGDAGESDDERPLLEPDDEV